MPSDKMAITDASQSLLSIGSGMVPLPGGRKGGYATVKKNIK